MSDVFISYAREDQGPAERLAKALEAQGWSVWWDRKIPFGKPFDEVIEEALASARCVLVLWSASSIASRWVLEEAHYAYERRILVPVSVDGVAPPIGFRRAQTADLVAWDGQNTFPAFRKLLADVHGVIASGPEAPPSESAEIIGHRREAAKAEREAWSEYTEPRPPPDARTPAQQKRSYFRHQLRLLILSFAIVIAAPTLLIGLAQLLNVGVPAPPEMLPPPDDGGEDVPREPEDSAQTPAPASARLFRDAQEELKRLGYYPGPVDGIWGPLSHAALEDFQREQGLDPKGIVTPAVLERLRQTPSPVSVRRPQPPETATSTASGCIITVDHGLVPLKYEPGMFSADILRIPVGDYPVLSHAWTARAGAKQLWFKIEANGREGWVLGDNWSIANRRGASCP